jgi:hypothetical protein
MTLSEMALVSLDGRPHPASRNVAQHRTPTERNEDEPCWCTIFDLLRISLCMPDGHDGNLRGSYRRIEKTVKDPCSLEEGGSGKHS